MKSPEIRTKLLQCVGNIPKKSQTWCLNRNSQEGQSNKWIFLCSFYVLFSFSFEVIDLDSDDAKDNVLSPNSPAADFPAETEIINPVSKKNVTVKKTAKGEPKSQRWVNNIGIN